MWNTALSCGLRTIQMDILESSVPAYSELQSRVFGSETDTPASYHKAPQARWEDVSQPKSTRTNPLMSFFPLHGQWPKQTLRGRHPKRRKDTVEGPQTKSLLSCIFVLHARVSIFIGIRQKHCLHLGRHKQMWLQDHPCLHLQCHRG
jgi:hypothetical protein